MYTACKWREELTNSTYLLNIIPVKCQIVPLDNQLSLCTTVCTVEGQLTYYKFVFTVLVTEPKSEKQKVLVEMEKKLCNHSLIQPSVFSKLFGMFQPVIDHR